MYDTCDQEVRRCCLTRSNLFTGKPRPSGGVFVCYNAPMIRRRKTSKYRNVKTVLDGVTFDSKKEAARYAHLKLMEKSGVISDLELQPRYPITIGAQKVCTYVADFRYQQDGKTIVEDVKSAYTAKQPVYRLKKKLVKAVYGIDITEV